MCGACAWLGAARRQVFLVDFNPLGGLTQPLLFEWPDLPAPEAAAAGGGGGGPALRRVAAPPAIRPPMAM